jgi:hypothetical protein
MSKRRRIVLLTALVILAGTFAFAHGRGQATKNKSIEVPTIEPRPEDVSSVDGLIKAFYETISGPAGQPRQWGRDRTLYVPGVRFVSTGVRKDGKPYAVVSGHQEYVDATNDSMVREGFFEHEIHRVTHTYGNITHVWSTYESRVKADRPVTARGINSVELFFDGKRWWIATATWADETPHNPIPKEYLP